MGMEENMIQSMFGPAENYENAQRMMPWEILGAGVGAAGSIASAGIKAGVI